MRNSDGDPTAFVLRSYGTRDAEGCARVFERAWNSGHPYAPRTVGVDAFLSELAGRALVVAQARDGQILGFAGVHVRAGFIHHLYVDPDRAGRGIGRALLRAGVALAGGRASLKCQVRNVRALAFYRREGWTEGERGEAGGEPWVRLHSPETKRR